MRLTFHHVAMTFLTAVFLTANPLCSLLSAADEEVVDTFIAPAMKDSSCNSDVDIVVPKDGSLLAATILQRKMGPQ